MSVLAEGPGAGWIECTGKRLSPCERADGGTWARPDRTQFQGRHFGTGGKGTQAEVIVLVSPKSRLKNERRDLIQRLYFTKASGFWAGTPTFLSLRVASFHAGLRVASFHAAMGTRTRPWKASLAAASGICGTKCFRGKQPKSGSSLVAERVEAPAFSPLWLWLPLCGVGSIPGPGIPPYCLCGKKENKYPK